MDEHFDLSSQEEISDGHLPDADETEVNVNYSEDSGNDAEVPVGRGRGREYARGQTFQDEAAFLVWVAGQNLWNSQVNF